MGHTQSHSKGQGPHVPSSPQSGNLSTKANLKLLLSQTGVPSAEGKPAPLQPGATHLLIVPVNNCPHSRLSPPTVPVTAIPIGCGRISSQFLSLNPILH